MASRVRVVVGTFGSPAWAVRAGAAMASAAAQTVPCEVVHAHGASLAEARNLGAAGKWDWLVTLDADDTLDARYVEAMLKGEGDLRQPATLGVHPDGHEDESGPVLIPSKRLIDGNYLVCGTMMARWAFEAAGGWGDEPIYEDWALWLRARIRMATVGQVSDAVYRVGVNPASRNNADRAEQMRWYHAIRDRHLVEAHRLEREEGWVL